MNSQQPIPRLDDALTCLQARSVRLALSLIRRDFLVAWSNAQEVRRALELTDAAAVAQYASVDSARTLTALQCAYWLAEMLLNLAPCPSHEAIRQARRSDPHADRDQWNREERDWIASWDERVKQLQGLDDPAIEGQPLAQLASLLSTVATIGHESDKQKCQEDE